MTIDGCENYSSSNLYSIAKSGRAAEEKTE